MAILWEKRHQKNRYRVTQAGNAIRLYRNHVLHSQWNPKSPLSGKLWDLFLLTSLDIETPICSVLVLGAGGGTVINLVHHFFPQAKVDAVDSDQRHIFIAKNYFKVSKKHCALFHQDARVWLKKHKKAYDLVIDDVFFERDDLACRSVDAHVKWIKALLKHTKKHGVLVINYADNKEWKKARQEIAVKEVLKNYHMGIACHHQCDNKIVHITKNAIAARIIKTKLARFAEDYLRYWQNKTFLYRQIQ